MIIRMGKKDVIKIGCFSGVLFGFAFILLFAIMGQPLIPAIIRGCLSGIIYGVLWAFGVSLWSKFIEKKTINLRNEISKDRKVICEGATINKTVKNVNGWLVLSEAAVEFYPVSTGGGMEATAILLDDIIGTSTKKNLLIIKSNSKVFIFQVYNACLWEEMIQKEL